LASDPFYVPLSYPRYAASLFADNDLARSSMAAGCILFARPLFISLGVAKGVSVLGWAQHDQGFWYDGYLPYRGEVWGQI
jgi:hypothetical protein